jgi:hypothetical protein
LNRVWKAGNEIEIRLPMELHIDSMPNDETIQAAIYGPLVLARRFKEVTKDTSQGHYGPKPGSERRFPDIVAALGKPITWIESDARHSLSFRAMGQSQPFPHGPLSTK